MKSELRQDYCTLRESLAPQETRAASQAVCERLAGFDPLLRANTAMAYLAFRSEIDLAALFDTLTEICWVMPRVDGAHMVAHAFDPAHLIRHRFGMLEPAPETPVVPAAEIDVVLVPGVAFDRRGGRLGFGGGYYDRFLPTTRALRVGVSHTMCVADELPREPHDARMDWVVSPAETIRCVPTSRGALRRTASSDPARAGARSGR
jgi:5-formyltetrahydrofolate cyclo-ligase